MLISAENISKSYNTKNLFKNINIYINKGDKIGLIGHNGAGKSTILKILAKKEEPDTGGVKYDPLVKVSYLSQQIDLDENLTAKEVVMKISSIDDYQATSNLSKLGLENCNCKISQMSGGERRKVAIAASLFQESDCLIIDEITNHLDTKTIIAIEKYLIKYTGAIIMVTHDRYFLKRICNKIAEIVNDNIIVVDGNYEKYLESKALIETTEATIERKKQAFLRKEYEWIKRGPQARATKDKKRIKNYEKLINEEKTVKSEIKVQNAFSRLGKKTIVLDNISKYYQDKVIIKDFSYILDLNSRIGVVGENGAGKTTLLNIMSGIVSIDKGIIEIGETVRIGYLKQENEDLPEDKRVIDYINNIALEFKVDNLTISASQMLENFLFTKEEQYAPISKLSGGEKRRLHLLGVLVTNPNILLLDEPTNDLDIDTLNILEEYIANFKGPVCIVSHDRYFLDKTIDRILIISNTGEVIETLGSYDEYLSYANKKNKVTMKDVENTSKVKPKKLTFNEQKEYSIIEDEIEILENELKEITITMEKYYDNYEEYRKLLINKEELENKLEQKIARWSYLSEIALN